jgi:hypothetical protein
MAGGAAGPRSVFPFEPARCSAAYWPVADIAADALQATARETTHQGGIPLDEDTALAEA